MSSISRTLTGIYDALLSCYGPQGWWPGDGSTETIIGAILVQHAAWSQVEQAIEALKQADALDFETLDRMPADTLATLVRPAGMPGIKAQRLKSFAQWLGTEYGYDLQFLSVDPLDTLRDSLLAINGIGPETADCILLYAGNRSTFVVDAYARRLLIRHGIISAKDDYMTIKQIIERNVPKDVAVYNEFHALIVQVGKVHCKRVAKCTDCPLAEFEHDETIRF